MKTLSSICTLWVKFVFPAIWISALGFVTATLWIDSLPCSFRTVSGSPPSDAKMLMSLFTWSASSAFVLWQSGGLKKVRMDETNLYVSNYLRDISVPLDMIAEVSENGWLTSHPITIRFQCETRFGRIISFMPTLRFLHWGSHPVAAELRRAAGEPD